LNCPIDTARHGATVAHTRGSRTIGTYDLLKAYKKKLPRECSVGIRDRYMRGEAMISHVTIQFPKRPAIYLARLIVIEESGECCVFREMNVGRKVDADIESIKDMLGVT